jgi:hypothetical protein
MFDLNILTEPVQDEASRVSTQIDDSMGAARYEDLGADRKRSAPTLFSCLWLALPPPPSASEVDIN